MRTINSSAIAAVIERQQADQPFSGVVQVREIGGEVIFAQAYGHAHQAEAIPNTVETRFATASGCKIFTAIAVLQLIEAGRFQLETPLREVLSLPYPYTLDSAITVRHLLTHTSGLPDYYDEEELSDEDCLAIWDETPVYTLRRPADYLPLFMQRPPKFAPGARFHYNNGAFVLLALLVEQQSGQPFPDYVTEHILAPAGMADSGYFRLDALPARTAQGYLRQEDGSFRHNLYTLPIIGSGDGGAYVTAPDWSRFWEALYGHQLLSPAMTAAMLTPHVKTGHATLDQRYGYGVWIMVDEAGEVFERYVVGADFGVGMVSAVFPGLGVELTILDNVGDGVWGLWGALVKAFEGA